MDIGQPFAYYPQIAKLCGGVKEGIFLCRIIWWQRDPGEWVTKTMEEIADATGLSLKEQRSARLELKVLGILKEMEDRLAHELSYRIDFEALDALWDGAGISRSAQTAFRGVPKRHSGECPNGIPSIGKDGTKDSTKETPAEPVLALDRPKAQVQVARRPDTLIDVDVIPRKPKAVPEVPIVMPAVLAASPEFFAKWDKWQTARRAMRKPKNWSVLFQEQLDWLSKYSPEVATQILSNSIMNGWQGLFEPKNGHAANGGNGKVPAWQERKEWQEQLKRAEDEIKTLMSGDSHADLDFVEKATLKRARAVRDEMRQKLGYKI
jgi:hypothetical protein